MLNNCPMRTSVIPSDWPGHWRLFDKHPVVLSSHGWSWSGLRGLTEGWGQLELFVRDPDPGKLRNRDHGWIG